MSKYLLFSLFPVIIAGIHPAQAGWLLCDEFDSYLEGTPITGNWIQQTGAVAHFISGYQGDNGYATSDNIDNAKMTMNPSTYEGRAEAVRFDIDHSASMEDQYAAAILAFRDGLNQNDTYLKVQFQSNPGTYNFHTVLFYLVKNGTTQLGWNGITDGGPEEILFLDHREFSDARIATEFKIENNGGQMTGRVNVWVDLNPNDDIYIDYSMTRGGIPLDNLGNQVGVEVHGRARIDNFQIYVPEVGALAYLAAASGVSLCFRRRQAQHIRRSG